MKTKLLTKQTFREFRFNGAEPDVNIDDQSYSLHIHLKDDETFIKVIVLKYEQV